MKNISSILSPVGNLLVDAENIDAVLGLHILRRKPESRERVRYDRLRLFVDDNFGQGWNIIVACPRAAESIGLHKFAYKLESFGVNVIFAEDYLSSATKTGKDPVVDRFIRTALEELIDGDSDVGVMSHDGHFAAPLMDMRVKSKDRRLAVFGFREHFNTAFGALARFKVDVLDLEQDCAAFDTLLPNRPKLSSRWESPPPCNSKIVIPCRGGLAGVERRRLTA